MSTAITETLEEQYKLAENFANAQARFLNAWMNHSSSARGTNSVVIAFEQLDQCRRRLRSNWRKMHEDDAFRIKHNHHIELSRRVIQTLSQNPAFGSYGFPRVSRGTLEANTVALASLRASIALVKESELH